MFSNQFRSSSEVTVDDSVGKKTDVSSCERLSGMLFFLSFLEGASTLLNHLVLFC